MERRFFPIKSKEVYFKSENDAEAAKAELERLQVSNITIEEVPEDTLARKPFIPLAPGFAGPTGLEAAPLDNKDKLEKEREETVTHLLRFDVENENEKEARSILEKRDCYREKPEE